MKRLWVQISATVTGILAGFIVLPVLLIIILNTSGVVELGWASDAHQGRANETTWQSEPSPLTFTINLLRPLLLISGLGIAAGVPISRQISKPITQLAAAAQAIGSRDLTRRVKVKGSQEIQELAEAFNQMAADLERAEHLRQNLMADVAHELRTPLAALEGNLRAALDHVYQLDDEGIAHLYEQTHHLTRLVNDLHELSMAEAKQLPLYITETDLTSVLEETIAILSPLAADQGVTLESIISAPLPTVQVDGSRIRQVLHNLLSNALRHTPAGGTITLKARQINNELTISVTDSGEGIAPEHIPYLFERFYRTDSSRSRDTGGTGLGLAIVKAIVESHGGRVTVVSKGNNGGSTFTVSLPLA